MTVKSALACRLLGPGGLYDWSTVLEAVELAAPSVVGSHAWSSCNDLAAMLASLSQVDFAAALGKTTQQLYSSQQSEVSNDRIYFFTRIPYDFMH